MIWGYKNAILRWKQSKNDIFQVEIVFGCKNGIKNDNFQVRIGSKTHISHK
jgi:hypothetical protein